MFCPYLWIGVGIEGEQLQVELIGQGCSIAGVRFAEYDVYEVIQILEGLGEDPVGGVLQEFHECNH